MSALLALSRDGVRGSLMLRSPGRGQAVPAPSSKASELEVDAALSVGGFWFFLVFMAVGTLSIADQKPPGGFGSGKGLLHAWGIFMIDEPTAVHALLRQASDSVKKQKRLARPPDASRAFPPRRPPPRAWPFHRRAA